MTRVKQHDIYTKRETGKLADYYIHVEDVADIDTRHLRRCLPSPWFRLARGSPRLGMLETR